MKERMKVWDHVDVLCLVSFDEFIKDLKETRKAIMEKYPETKKSKFKISVGPLIIVYMLISKDGQRKKK